MIRQTKLFLVISCMFALAYILFRFVRLNNGEYVPEMKIFSFKLGKNTVLIKQGNQVEDVEWTMKEQPVIKETLHVNDVNDETAKPPIRATVFTNPHVQTEARNDITVKVSTMKPMKPTTQEEKVPVVVATQPPTKQPTTKKVVLATTQKVTVSVVTVRPGIPGQCPHGGENLVGPLAVDQNVPETEDKVEDDWDEKGWVEKGGAWRPKKCQAASKVAIIIPYRNREQQLKIFLRHMHPFLKRQLLDYRIVVAEQAGDTPFNRAMLFNIGYKESLKFRDFNCFIFHDVDLIPENDKNYYGCPSGPRHLSVAIDKFNYRLPYKGIFGGAGAFRKEDFEKINGFSNQFWGWGGEDDDLYRRITAKGFQLTRPSMVVGRYKMVRIFHQSAKADPLRFQKLRNSKERMASDGLNSLKYKVQKVVERPLYTKVTVEVNPDEV